MEFPLVPDSRKRLYLAQILVSSLLQIYRAFLRLYRALLRTYLAGVTMEVGRAGGGSGISDTID